MKRGRERRVRSLWQRTRGFETRNGEEAGGSVPAVRARGRVRDCASVHACARGRLRKNLVSAQRSAVRIARLSHTRA